MFYIINRIINLFISYCIQLLHLIPKAVFFIPIFLMQAFLEMVLDLKTKNHHRKEK